METQICKHDTRITIDNLASKLQNKDVIRVADIKRALERRYRSDMSDLRGIRKEQDKLREQWMRFTDLDEQAKRKEERLRRTVGLLGDSKLTDLDNAADGDLMDSFVVSVSALTLWEAILAIVEQISEIQIYELQHVLEQLGKKVSRQAVESAIDTHKSLFVTKIRGREKFVSLKR